MSKFSLRAHARPRGPLLAGVLCCAMVLASPLRAQPVESGHSAQQASENALSIRPPQLRSQVDAIYPNLASGDGVAAHVEILVTVTESGTVEDAEVVRSGGPDFDAAALDAVSQWTFFPAMQGEQAVPSRIRIPFDFSAPVGEPEPSPSSRVDVASEAEPPVSDASTEMQVEVVGHRRDPDPQRSASDIKVKQALLLAVPRKEGADVLAAAPGVTMGRGEGMAVAHNYMLRGFDAEHGQDIEFHVGGIPVNLPSHIHGQGYSDLGFLIPGAVSQLRVKEGVYDPGQGDFAVAGSIDLELGVSKRNRGFYSKSSGGSFFTLGQELRWAPKEQDEGRFAAALIAKTRGFGEQRAGERASLIWQHTWGEGSARYRSLAIVSAANAAMAGVLRQDDIEAGRVCWTCSYPFATAKAQRANAQRLMTGMFGEHEQPRGGLATWGVWASLDRFRIQQNFTGFIQKSRRLGRVRGRGDLIEQSNRTLSVGAKARYRHRPLRFGTKGQLRLATGFSGRLDRVSQSQRLLAAALRNQIWDERVDATVLGADLGIWADGQMRLLGWLTLRAGLRADLLTYDIEDRLGNKAPIDRPQNQFLPGYRRSASGLALGPRVSASVSLSPRWSLMAAWGQGYRSAQARQLEDGERAPFTRVRSADFGVRWSAESQGEISASAYWTELSDDIAFEAQEGRLERIGASRRVGGVLHAQWRPAPWTVAGLSVTGVHATLQEPPPPTPEEPQPPFRKGQSLPYVPSMVVRLDAGIAPPLAWAWKGHSFHTRAGIGYSMWSPRPLPFGRSTEFVHLLDLSAAFGWGPVTLGASLHNALNRRYGAVEYNFASDWNPYDGFRSRTPQRHRSVGAPLSAMAFLELQL